MDGTNAPSGEDAFQDAYAKAQMCAVRLVLVCTSTVCRFMRAPDAPS